MHEMAPDNSLPAPLQLTATITAHSVSELADALLAASDAQRIAKRIEDPEAQFDFLQACDAFNLSRMEWRLQQEIEDGSAVARIRKSLCRVICERRAYDPNEFSLASEATESRARFPFGLDPLQHANFLAEKAPIRILNPEVQDPLSRRILAIAVQLQKINSPRPVLLPIEHLRTILRCRKLVAGGAVKRLIRCELLQEIGQKAHTGKAREFRVLAKEAVDYEFENGARTEPKPRL
jgi:hypothetical protein